MPSLRELVMLRAAFLAREGATFKIDDRAWMSCVKSGWLTREDELTAAGERLLLEETSGGD